MLPPRAIVRHRETISVIIALSFVVLYLFGGLLTNVPLKNHETPNLYYRIHQYVAELQQYGFPATLFPDALQGGGFAFPAFYPPLSYYVGALLALVSDSYYFAGNLALFLSVLVSSYACYYGFSKIGGKLPAFTAAVLYITIPYRFVDAIARGALAECWTFVWFPLIFCGGIFLLQSQYRKGVLFLAFSSAALILSHAVMALYFLSICIVIYLMTCLVSRRLLALVYSIMGLVFAAGFTAWYVIPQRMLWSAVKASDPAFMWAVLEGVQKHNVSVSQLFFSDPARWLGGSNEGLYKDAMSFELGYASLITACIVTLGYLWGPKRRKSNAEDSLRYCTIAAWLLSIVFVLRCQVFLKHIPESYLFIQFGWRMLGITAFFCVAAYALAVNVYRIPRRFGILLTIAVVIGSIASVDSTYRVVQYFENYPDDPLTSESVKMFGDKGYVEIREYVPHGFVEHEMHRLRIQEPVAMGDLQVESTDMNDGVRTYNVSAKTSSTLILPLVSYPFYEATSNHGRALVLGAHNGLLTITAIQPGDNSITLRRVLSEPHRLGLLVSGATLLLFGVFWFLPIWNIRNDRT